MRWLIAVALLCAVPHAAADSREVEDPAGDQQPFQPWTDLRALNVTADGWNVTFEVLLAAMPAERSFYQLDLMPYGWQYYAGCRIGPNVDGSDPGPDCTFGTRERVAEGGPGASASTVRHFLFVETDPGLPGFRVTFPYALVDLVTTTAIEKVQVAAGPMVAGPNGGGTYPHRSDSLTSDPLDWRMPGHANATRPAQPWFPRSVRFVDAASDQAGKMPGADIRAMSVIGTNASFDVHIELDGQPAVRTNYQANVLTAETIYLLTCSVGPYQGVTAADASCTWHVNDRSASAAGATERVAVETTTSAFVAHVPWSLVDANGTIERLTAMACVTLAYDVAPVATGWTCPEAADEGQSAPWWPMLPRGHRLPPPLEPAVLPAAGDRQEAAGPALPLLLVGLVVLVLLRRR